MDNVVITVDETTENILVSVTEGAANLAELNDTTITSPVTGESLLYNSVTETWENGTLSGSGDMLQATYDPTTVNGDAFDMDNMSEGSDTKILTAAERAEIAANTSKVSFPEAPEDGNEYARKNGAWSVVTGGGGGVTDHGALTGLNDDDHLQYHTDGRADNWLSTKSTTDVSEGINLYYTEARVSANADVTANTSKVSYTDAAKVAGIETGAQVNPTDAEIKTAYENNADTNAFTDAEKTKLSNIADGAEVNVNADWNAVSGDSEILNKPSLYDSSDFDSDFSSKDSDDLSQGTTNLYLTGAERSKLSGIETGATSDQSDSEIETAYNNQVDVVSQAEAEAGIATTVRRWTAQRVAQAIAALASGGGAVWGAITGTLSDQTDLQNALDGKSDTTHTHTASDVTDFDTEVANNTAVTANTAKVTNATHTGEVTGSGALTLGPTAITNKTLVTASSADHVLISDVSDSGNLKKALVSDLLGSGTDPDAIHDNAAGEIAAITSKATPTTSDYLLIEDAADSNNKKKITIGDLPSAGGGSSPIVSAYKTADETRTSTTSLIIDTDLQLSLEANAVYHVSIVIRTNSHSTPKFKLSPTVPTGATLKLSQDLDNISGFAFNEGKQYLIGGAGY
jgi:hypothetical protein